jgi:chemotaxis methyl-accepting protein methylase
MLHPLKDKLFVFIRNLMRYFHQEVRDALEAIGGFTDER